ncbi:MAG: tRNA epoxyqueuosine(34) reductase QueG [Bacteroidota bacterium]
MQYSPERRSEMIREEAMRLGFLSCTFSQAGFLEEEAPLLEQWLLGNRHGKMAYMERYFDERLDPRLLVPGARSVVSLLYNYFPGKNLCIDGRPKVSRYAYGEDYHFVVKDKMHELLNQMREMFGQISGRVFVDSAPVLEKAWAVRSGSGWMGKNGNLLNRTAGSYFFIGELIIDLELKPDGKAEDFCGTCTRCIDACPTEAIIQPRVVDGSKCISYFTIELKEEIPASQKGKFGDWVFGCDVCQEVCPWNRFSKPHAEPRFSPREPIGEWSEIEWDEMDSEVFLEYFKDSPLKRTGFEGMRRNLSFRKNNS